MNESVCVCVQSTLHMPEQPLLGQSVLIIAGSRLSSYTIQSLGLLWTADLPEAQIST